MRVIIYIVIVVLVLSAPVERLDVAKLLPVEAVAVYKEAGKVVLMTDTEDRGQADTVEAALKDLKENALGIIYLDTADFLLVGAEAEKEAEELKRFLNGGIRVGGYSGGDVKEEAAYLDAHWESKKPKGK